MGCLLNTVTSILILIQNGKWSRDPGLKWWPRAVALIPQAWTGSRRSCPRSMSFHSLVSLAAAEDGMLPSVLYNDAVRRAATTGSAVKSSPHWNGLPLCVSQCGGLAFAAKSVGDRPHGDAGNWHRIPRSLEKLNY